MRIKKVFESRDIEDLRSDLSLLMNDLIESLSLTELIRDDEGYDSGHYYTDEYANFVEYTFKIPNIYDNEITSKSGLSNNLKDIGFINNLMTKLNVVCGRLDNFGYIWSIHFYNGDDLMSLKVRLRSKVAA